MATQIAAHFRFIEDWYRSDRVVALVLAYYALLRSILRAQPALRRCLARCRHCGIFFLTHPRNAGREDLRCPFGCREAHRRRQSDLGRRAEGWMVHSPDVTPAARWSRLVRPGAHLRFFRRADPGCIQLARGFDFVPEGHLTIAGTLPNSPVVKLEPAR